MAATYYFDQPIIGDSATGGNDSSYVPDSVKPFVNKEEIGRDDSQIERWTIVCGSLTGGGATRDDRTSDPVTNGRRPSAKRKTSRLADFGRGRPSHVLQPHA
ncbi:eukaryotic translation initiation factor 3subunit L [Striga asiatica]|uniref:Eukaryotic translation initiation factor 3subunit L n=1 Tax=Striga asiatica TaxID=4170 RepID=A0A5A7P6V2_STRAF|nr:eukaryotic translation initiation factor 3subunit L [Striga asiatica]